MLTPTSNGNDPVIRITFEMLARHERLTQLLGGFCMHDRLDRIDRTAVEIDTRDGLLYLQRTPLTCFRIEAIPVEQAELTSLFC